MGAGFFTTIKRTMAYGNEIVLRADGANRACRMADAIHLAAHLMVTMIHPIMARHIHRASGFRGCRGAGSSVPPQAASPSKRILANTGVTRFISVFRQGLIMRGARPGVRPLRAWKAGLRFGNSGWPQLQSAC